MWLFRCGKESVVSSSVRLILIMSALSVLWDPMGLYQTTQKLVHILIILLSVKCKLYFRVSGAGRGFYFPSITSYASPTAHRRAVCRPGCASLQHPPHNQCCI